MLLIVDSGYPFHIGGVGTVVDQLLAANPELSFGIVHLYPPLRDTCVSALDRRGVTG
ncbi:DUF3492 domain-containing protein [Corynebacterium sp. CCM 8864]|uniref:DUF3492 domain-containing protein n=1 Tax=Corynebacterium marambiense TaxID=2765364 RepID=A0ABS0VRJ6_9CORY|nr:DUF3492 domain-containing protein [Corynebacterium marambiense]